MTTPTSDKQVILITGASAGFGRLTAEKLLAEGHIVYAAARRVEKMLDLEASGAVILEMDVTDDQAVEAGVDKLIAEQGRIDVLVNNAGYGSYGMVECVPMEEIKHQFDVNVFGYGRLIQAVLPHMRARKQGKIINVASIVSHVSAPLLGWYVATKHAIKGMTEALRMEVKQFDIEVVQIEPGAVKTEFDEVSFATLEKVEHPEDYRTLLDGMHQALVNMYKTCPGPESTANAIVRAIKARQPNAVYRTTMDARILPLVRALVGPRLYGNLMLKMAK
jgi:short-subunit dehydrogenase